MEWGKRKPAALNSPCWMEIKAMAIGGGLDTDPLDCPAVWPLTHLFNSTQHGCSITFQFLRTSQRKRHAWRAGLDGTKKPNWQEDSPWLSGNLSPETGYFGGSKDLAEEKESFGGWIECGKESQQQGTHRWMTRKE